MTESTGKTLREDIKWFLTIATIIVSMSLAYGSLVTKIALVEQRLNTIETNHLVHIQTAIEKLEGRVHEIELNK